MVLGLVEAKHSSTPIVALYFVCFFVLAVFFYLLGTYLTKKFYKNDRRQGTDNVVVLQSHVPHNETVVANETKVNQDKDDAQYPPPSPILANAEDSLKRAISSSSSQATDSSSSSNESQPITPEPIDQQQKREQKPARALRRRNRRRSSAKSRNRLQSRSRNRARRSRS